MTKIKRPDDPYWKRETIFDKHLLKWRKQFWDEVSLEQQYAEMEYQAKMNRQLLAEINGSKRHERTKGHS